VALYVIVSCGGSPRLSTVEPVAASVAATE
jgi:hypothetical protein